MTPEEFLSEFGTLVELDGGINQLRALARDLAIAGRMIGEPSSWSTRPLGSVAEVQIGPFGSLLHKADYKSGGTPLINPANMRNGILVPDPEKAVSRDTIQRLALYVMRAGDVVMARRGEMGRCAVVRPENDGWLCGTGSLFLRFREAILPDFAAHWVRSTEVRTRLAGESVGSTMANLNLRILHGLNFATPPLPEQKRIVAKVDQLMALCDDLEAAKKKRRETSFVTNKAVLSAVTSASGTKELKESWKRVQDNFEVLYDAPENVQELRQTILQLAVMGKFSRNASPWSTTTLSEVGKWASGSGFPAWAQGSTGQPILFCKVSDMNLAGNEVHIHSTANTIDEATAKRLRAAAHPPGTVIFPKIGGAIATNKRRILVRPTAIDNNCMGITPGDSCSTAYLYLLLRSIDFTRYQAGTSIPALSQGALSQVTVLLPPLPEQKRIVEKVDQLMALCDDLDSRLQKSRTDGEALMKAVVEHLVSAPGTSSEPMAMVG